MTWSSRHHLDTVQSDYFSLVNTYAIFNDYVELRFEDILVQQLTGITSKTRIQNSTRQPGKLELISLCQLNAADCREGFHHYPTSKGICSGLNSMPLRQLLTETHHEFIDLLATSFNVNENTPVPMLSMGVSSKLTLMLDSHSSELGGTGQKNVLFLVGIGQALDAFDMSTQVLAVGPGQQHNLKITTK